MIYSLKIKVIKGFGKMKALRFAVSARENAVGAFK